MMNLLSELSSSRSGMLRLAVVGITCIAMLVVLWQALPAIDSFTYAQAYAYGNVSQGYMSQAEGARLLDRELQGAIEHVWPLALQALGVLAVAALLDIAIRKTDRGQE